MLNFSVLDKKLGSYIHPITFSYVIYIYWKQMPHVVALCLQSEPEFRPDLCMVVKALKPLQSSANSPLKRLFCGVVLKL